MNNISNMSCERPMSRQHIELLRYRIIGRSVKGHPVLRIDGVVGTFPNTVNVEGPKTTNLCGWIGDNESPG